jgi:hypothetical protein
MADWGQNDPVVGATKRAPAAATWGASDPVVKPKGEGTRDKPYDLSGGYEGVSIPRGSFYRDARGNIRQNENGLTRPDGRPQGNPIVQPSATRGQPRNALDEASGLLANFYRGTGILDEANAGVMSLGNAVFGGGVPIERKPGESPYSPMPLVRSVAGTYQNALARQRGSEDDFRTRRPLVAGLSQAAGSASTVMVPGGAASQLAAAPSRIVGGLRGAAVGGAQAYAYGVADRGTAQERFATGSRNIPLGVALGSTLGAVTTPGRGRPPARAELDALQARAPVDVQAARTRAGEFRGAGINPTLVDVVDDSGRGLVRATAGRMTPARQAATDFRDARALDLPDRIGGQARRLISNDPRTPDQIRAALATDRGDAADLAFGAVRDARLTLEPDAVLALRSPDGRAAIKSAANDAMNSLDPADRALAAELNRLADEALDDPSTQITVGMAQSISKSLLDAADAASRAGRNNSARILGELGRAIRGNAGDAVPAYKGALEGYTADSRLIEAADVGEQFMARNTDEFSAAVGAMDDGQLQVARAAARRAVERAAGESPGAAPGVARRIATAPEQGARNTALLGPTRAGEFQNALRMEEMAVRNAGDVAPRIGSQTQLRSQDAERAADAIGVGWKIAKQDWIGLAGDWLRSRGIKDPIAQQITEVAINPAALDDALIYLEQRYGPQAAQAFQQFRSRAIIDATRAGRAGGLVGANTNSTPQNALATSP